MLYCSLQGSGFGCKSDCTPSISLTLLTMSKLVSVLHLPGFTDCYMDWPMSSRDCCLAPFPVLEGLCVICQASLWVLRMQTQIPTLAWQGLYWLSHLPRPRVWIFERVHSNHEALQTQIAGQKDLLSTSEGKVSRRTLSCSGRQLSF